MQPEQVKLLGLSRSELRVLEALREGNTTPLLIAKHTKIRRPTVYQILPRLHKRGLAKTFIRNGKKYWRYAKDIDLEAALYDTKKALFDFEDGREEVASRSDSTVIIHRGAEAIRKLIRSMFRDHKNERLYGIQGDLVDIGWNKVFGVEATNELNRWVKSNLIIVEALVPFGFFERLTAQNGIGWAKDFEGRMSVNHEIGKEYFEHGGKIWIFKNSLYLIAMNEEIIIEVRNSEIQKLTLSMFRFIQDNSRKFDVNARLRDIIAKEEGRAT